MRTRLRTGLACVILLAACERPPEVCGSWEQWGSDPAHAGQSCTAGQTLGRALASVVYDPFVAAEQNDAQGDILVHYQVPLVQGDDVFVEVKQGDYTPCDPPVPPSMFPDCKPYRLNSQVWAERRYHWQQGALVEKWTFASDWKPEPYPGFEPMFQPALVGRSLYVPGAGGALFRLDRTSGLVLAHLQPFGGAIDPDTYVSSPVAADLDGNVYYTALHLDHGDPWNTDAQGWLVRVSLTDKIEVVPFAQITPGAPGPTDACRRTFDPMATPLPWPPPPNPDGTPVLPPTAPCLSQRPAINAAPAIGADGTVFLVSVAHANGRYTYVVALRSDLKVKWVTSLRDFLHDGCGVLVPDDGNDTDLRFHCRPGATVGVDPRTNEPPAGRATDDSSSSPVALPDGGLLYGAYTSYNNARGHLFKLDRAGRILGTYDFGWDTTPAVYRHGNTYSVILKDNHYLYDDNGLPLGPYYIVQLDRTLAPEWRFQSTNTKSCHRDAQGAITCTDDHPNGFEWCINAPAVDRQGIVYVNSEDGNIYAIAQGGSERNRFFLDMAVGAAYTPLALDHRGLVYTLNGGQLSVLGR